MENFSFSPTDTRILFHMYAQPQALSSSACAHARVPTQMTTTEQLIKTVSC